MEMIKISEGSTNSNDYDKKQGNNILDDVNINISTNEHSKKTKAYQYKHLCPVNLSSTYKQQGEDKTHDIMIEYTNMLNYAFSEDEVRNIAITGNYGTGKSSVWKTYFEETLENNNSKNIYKKTFNKKSGEDKRVNSNEIIFVSLAAFKNPEVCENARDEDNDKKSLLNKVEQKIVDQIYYQIDEDDIPNVKKKKITKTEFFILYFIVIVILMFFGNEFANIDFRNLNIKIIVFLSAILVASYLISKFVEKIFYCNQFTKINFGGFGMQMKEHESEKTVFDKEMDKILYMLNEPKIKIVVFEDLDRFGNIELFTKLREINYLCNKDREIKGINTTLRFVYMVKDDLFWEKERTKFFDFIVPVIPFITSYNAETQMEKLFNGCDEDLRPLDSLIDNITLYVHDYRLILNIYNEYGLYIRNLNRMSIKEEKGRNTLLAVITIKNVYPDLFAKLIEDKGYLYDLFNERKKELRESIIKGLKNKKSKEATLLENQNNRISNKFIKMLNFMILSIGYGDISDNKAVCKFLKSWFRNPDEKYQLESSDLVKLSDSEINIEVSNQGSDLKTFVNKIIDKSLLNEKQKQEQKQEFIGWLDCKNLYEAQYNKSVKNIEIEINIIRDCPLQELIKKSTSDEIEMLFNLREKSNNNNNVRDLGIVRFLVANGYFNETYPMYISYFHEGGLSYRDEEFLKEVLGNRYLSWDYVLDNPKKILEKLEGHSQSNGMMLNRCIIDSLNDDKKERQIYEIIYSAYQYNYSYLLNVIKICSTEDFNKIINIFLTYDKEIAWSFEFIKDLFVCVAGSDKLELLANDIKDINKIKAANKEKQIKIDDLNKFDNCNLTMTKKSQFLYQLDEADLISVNFINVKYLLEWLKSSDDYNSSREKIKDILVKMSFRHTDKMVKVLKEIEEECQDLVSEFDLEYSAVRIIMGNEAQLEAKAWIFSHFLKREHCSIEALKELLWYESVFRHIAKVLDNEQPIIKKEENTAMEIVRALEENKVIFTKVDKDGVRLNLNLNYNNQNFR